MTAERHHLVLDRSRRIVRKRDFERAFAGRCSAGDPRLVVYVVPNGLDHPRLGMVVGRRHGPAVRRNRLRRLLREAFRLEQHSLPGGFDYLILPKVGARVSLDDCRRSVLRLSHSAVKRWNADPRRQEQRRP